MFNSLRVGIRPSPLALKQAEELKQRLWPIRFDYLLIKTKGDKDKVTALTQFEGSDFFTSEIEEALLEGKIDAAVHSAKDLEERPPEQIVTACITKSLSPFECLVSRNKLKLAELPRGSVIGTSSKKRKSAILSFRQDLVVKDIRGNIEERLAQLDKGDFDAIIVAHAALIRLGYEDRITEIVPREIIEPHPLQGKLAVQVRKDREEIVEIFRSIDAK